MEKFVQLCHHNIFTNTRSKQGEDMKASEVRMRRALHLREIAAGMEEDLRLCQSQSIEFQERHAKQVIINEQHYDRYIASRGAASTAQNNCEAIEKDHAGNVQSLKKQITAQTNAFEADEKKWISRCKVQKTLEARLLAQYAQYQQEAEITHADLVETENILLNLRLTASELATGNSAMQSQIHNISYISEEPSLALSIGQDFPTRMRDFAKTTLPVMLKAKEFSVEAFAEKVKLFCQYVEVENYPKLSHLQQFASALYKDDETGRNQASDAMNNFFLKYRYHLGGCAGEYDVEVDRKLHGLLREYYLMQTGTYMPVQWHDVGTIVSYEDGFYVHSGTKRPSRCKLLFPPLVALDGYVLCKGVTVACQRK